MEKTVPTRGRDWDTGTQFVNEKETKYGIDLGLTNENHGSQGHSVPERTWSRTIALGLWVGSTQVPVKKTLPRQDNRDLDTCKRKTHTYEKLLELETIEIDTLPSFSQVDRSNNSSNLFLMDCFILESFYKRGGRRSTLSSMTVPGKDNRTMRTKDTTVFVKTR